MTDCKEAYRHICENLDHDINSRQCRQIKRHLEGCPDCRAYLETLRKTVTLYRVAPEPELSSSIKKKLLKSIALEFGTQRRAGKRNVRRHATK